MTAEILDKTYTLEEFLELDLPDDEQYELINGRIVATKKNPGPSAAHGKVLINLGSSLKLFAENQTPVLGSVYGECSCTLGLTEFYIVPDLAFVTAERIPAGGFTGPLTVAPDLVAEINSPSDDIQKIHDKIESYLNAGVRLIWSIYLLEKHVIVYRPNQRKQFLDLPDKLDGADVLPGFKISVSNLFD